jgi:RNA polymerase sigma factor (sigma-70 family)
MTGAILRQIAKYAKKRTALCPSEFDDCMQEARLKIHKAILAGVDPKSGQYLLMCGRNAIDDFMRSNAFVTVRYHWRPKSKKCRQPVLLAGHLDEVFDYRERAARFSRRIKNWEDEFGPLTVRQRAILNALFDDSFNSKISVKRVAKVVGLATNTVRTEIRNIAKKGFKVNHEQGDQTHVS